MIETENNLSKGRISSSDTPTTGTASPQEMEQVYRLRYDIYVQEMGRRQTWAKDGEIREPLDDTGVVVVARHRGEVIGTCRVNFSGDSRFDAFDFHHLDAFNQIFPGKVGLATKMMARREWRGTNLFLELAKEIIRQCLIHDCRALIIDCNEHLLDAFGRMGFVAYSSLVHQDYGKVTLMVLFFEDVNHLRRIDSPFYELFEKEGTRYV